VTRGPFRADHVGSLLRPAALLDARRRADAGEISRAELRAIEDEAIVAAVALQEAAGLPSITDGEHRRAVWHLDFLTGFDGIERTDGMVAASLAAWRGGQNKVPYLMVVADKIRRSRPIAVDDFTFLKSRTTRTPKVCIPAPTTMHRGEPGAISKEAYPDIEEFWTDLIAAYRAEIDDLAAAGCTYLQLDEVAFAYFCDPSIRAQVKENGEDPDRLLEKFVEVINATVAGRPDTLTVTMHTCRGNFKSNWRASGAYDPVAELVFSGSDVDGLFLEYDTDRAGGFEPLRYVPKGKRVVLGLVSTKTAEMETKDSLKRRIEAAAKFVAMDDLCLSPQCGFASNHEGNDVTLDDERRKLELVVAVAEEVWGSAV